MKKIKIAVTGGIGSGKSVALEYLRGKGYPVFSCDEIYKKIIHCSEYIEKIGHLFPDVIIEGNINRRKLAEIVFTDEIKRKQLDDVAHPLIMQQLMSEMEKCADDLIFAEVPLLFEGGFEYLFDKIIVILRDKNCRIRGIEKRDFISMEEAEDRLKAQFDYDSPAAIQKMNDGGALIIYNNETTDKLYLAIDNLIEMLHS